MTEKKVWIINNMNIVILLKFAGLGRL